MQMQQSNTGDANDVYDDDANYMYDDDANDATIRCKTNTQECNQMQAPN